MTSTLSRGSHFFSKHILLIFLLFVVAPGIASGQEAPSDDPEGARVFKRHRISVGLGHAHIPAGREGEKKKWLNLGAFALDYDYSFNTKWSAGIHTDMVPSNYEVESDKEGENVLKRTSPVSAVLTVIYRINEHLGIQAGYGVEMTREESLSIVRIGLEYGWELPDDWELGLAVSYDRKVDTYNTWFLGIAISRWIGK